jgi:membrane-bound inhibitor of C-type lysozyme
MAAIITTPFRVLNAENFKEDVADANTSVYLGIGKSDAWSNTTSDLTDTTPTVPGDHRDDINEAYQQMIAMKLINASDVSHVVPRYNYADGASFVAWDSDDSDIFDKKFYCITSEFKVYKCISAGGGATSAQPVHTTTNPESLGDGYTWKYMYTVATSDSEKFLTNSYMPVSSLPFTVAANGTASIPSALLDTDVRYPQTASQVASYNSTTAAGIERIEVINGGIYSSTPTVTITGDGTGATATAVMSGSGATQTVASITVNTKGTDYTVSDITFSAGDASARGVIAPQSGHGTDPVGELGAFFVGLNTQLDGADGGDITIGNDFRQVVIVKNPYSTGTTVATSPTLKATKHIQLAAGQNVTNFVVDQVITGGTSGAKAYLVEIDASNLKLYYYQNSKTGYGVFANNEAITGSNPTGGSATTHASTAVNAAEVVKGSGQLVFLENRAPINRSASQIEDIKCIIEF